MIPHDTAIRACRNDGPAPAIRRGGSFYDREGRLPGKRPTTGSTHGRALATCSTDNPLGRAGCWTHPATGPFAPEPRQGMDGGEHIPMNGTKSTEQD